MIDHPIINFYLGKEDAVPFTIHNVIHASDADLESLHNYIQLVFPLFEASKFHPEMPVLTNEVVALFKEYTTFQFLMCQVFDRLLDFYNDDGNDWITPKNHNFLRINRILLSLNIMGLDDIAANFFDFLEDIYSIPENAAIIGDTTFRYWTAASKGISL